jgi:hypothetical protein
MSWQKYDLVFRLLAPMHIGWRKTSNLQQTRGYVTGKVFWAALTARLTREAEQGADGQAYQDIGKLVQKHFRFTYLYPATPNNSGYKTHYPWQDDFDYLFLDGYTSAALNYDNQSAEDGLLHETEFIAPRTRTDQPVYLKGSLYVSTSLPDNRLQNWQSALNKLQFGGERGYGWGRVQLVACAEKEMVASDEIQVKVAKNGRITAHLIAEKAANITGLIEPLIGWERNNTNNGNNKRWKLSDKAKICYAPGATITQDTPFTITTDGLWQLHDL